MPAILSPPVSASRKTEGFRFALPQLRRIPDRVRGQDMPLVRPSPAERFRFAEDAPPFPSAR